MAELNDRITDMDRVNGGLKEQIRENDCMMARFADEIRMMDVEVDKKRREQENLDQHNRRLGTELEDLKHLHAKFEQMKVTLDEEGARRVQAESECDRLRQNLAEV